MSELNIEPSLHCYLKGYWKALCDFGIWKNGERLIGCMETSIHEVMQRKLSEHEISYEDFMESIK